MATDSNEYVPHQCNDMVYVRFRVKVRVRVRVRVTVGVMVRVRGLGYFLRLHTPVSIVGLSKNPYSVIVNHKPGRILIRSSLSSQSPDFDTVHGQTALSAFG